MERDREQERRKVKEKDRNRDRERERESLREGGYVGLAFGKTRDRFVGPIRARSHKMTPSTIHTIEYPSSSRRYRTRGHPTKIIALLTYSST